MKCKLTFPSANTEEMIRPLDESPLDVRITLLFKGRDGSLDTLLAYRTPRNEWISGTNYYTNQNIIADGCIGWVPEPVFTIIKD